MPCHASSSAGVAVLASLAFHREWGGADAPPHSAWGQGCSAGWCSRAGVACREPRMRAGSPDLRSAAQPGPITIH